MPIYNKLVRDRIPTIIEQSGKTFTARILDDKEYRKELQKKAFEELEEYVQAETDGAALEELADVLEIIHVLAECMALRSDRWNKSAPKRQRSAAVFGRKFS
ncbi:hypothetical protein LR69_02714 [Geobacillus sp. BCO2]|nr:hypothetical protein LR69_02714 [Geobacillus sp. BCO2]